MWENHPYPIKPEEARFSLETEHIQFLKQFLSSYRKLRIYTRPYEIFESYCDGIYIHASDDTREIIIHLKNSFGDWSRNYISHYGNTGERLINDDIVKRYKLTLLEKTLIVLGVKNFDNRDGYNYQRLTIGWIGYHLEIDERSIYLPYKLF